MACPSTSTHLRIKASQDKRWYKSNFVHIPPELLNADEWHQTAPAVALTDSGEQARRDDPPFPYPISWVTQEAGLIHSLQRKELIPWGTSICGAGGAISSVHRHTPAVLPWPSSLETVRCLHTALVPLGNSVLLVDPARPHIPLHSCIKCCGFLLRPCWKRRL